MAGAAGVAAFEVVAGEVGDMRPPALAVGVGCLGGDERTGDEDGNQDERGDETGHARASYRPEPSATWRGRPWDEGAARRVSLAACPLRARARRDRPPPANWPFSRRAGVTAVPSAAWRCSPFPWPLRACSSATASAESRGAWLGCWPPRFSSPLSRCRSSSTAVRSRARIREDFANGTVEVLAITGAVPLNVPAMHSSVDPAFAIGLEGDRTLLLLGQWLSDPATFGRTRTDLTRDDDAGDAFANGLPPPCAFPTGAFTVHRFPVSGDVVRIELAGEYIAPADSGREHRPHDGERLSEPPRRCEAGTPVGGLATTTGVMAEEAEKLAEDGEELVGRDGGRAELADGDAGGVVGELGGLDAAWRPRRARRRAWRSRCRRRR